MSLPGGRAAAEATPVLIWTATGLLLNASCRANGTLETEEAAAGKVRERYYKPLAAAVVCLWGVREADGGDHGLTRSMMPQGGGR